MKIRISSLFFVVDAPFWGVDARRCTNYVGDFRLQDGTGTVLDLETRAWFSDINMIDPKRIEELGAKIGALIATAPVADLEKNMRALLSGFFMKLDLVGREEFEIQARLLQRANEKLDALEKRLAALETPRDA